jgi:hypothetical protein
MKDRNSGCGRRVDSQIMIPSKTLICKLCIKHYKAVIKGCDECRKLLSAETETRRLLTSRLQKR